MLCWIYIVYVLHWINTVRHIMLDILDILDKYCIHILHICILYSYSTHTVQASATTPPLLHRLSGSRPPICTGLQLFQQIIAIKPCYAQIYMKAAVMAAV